MTKSEFRSGDNLKQSLLFTVKNIGRFFRLRGLNCRSRTLRMRMGRKVKISIDRLVSKWVLLRRKRKHRRVKFRGISIEGKGVKHSSAGQLLFRHFRQDQHKTN